MKYKDLLILCLYENIKMVKFDVSVFYLHWSVATLSGQLGSKSDDAYSCRVNYKQISNIIFGSTYLFLFKMNIITFNRLKYDLYNIDR